MKSVLISIQPKWCKLIANGKKTVEVRKTSPKLETPFKCYIYCTQGRPLLTFTGLLADNGQKQINVNSDTHSQPSKNEVLLNGKVIGEFVCDEIWVRPANTLYLKNAQKDYEELLPEACLTEKEALSYMGGSYSKDMYFWHISDLIIYDTPKELGEFRKPCISAPTARCYPDNCECCPWNAITRPPQSWCYVED